MIVTSTRTFTLPLNNGADPWLLFYEGYYHLTTTQGDCIRMWKAKSLADLPTTEGVLGWRDDNPTRNQQVWAAEFHLLGNKWYLYYTASDGEDRNHRIYVLESEGGDPLGAYHFKAQLTHSWTIDPGLFVHPNGTIYFLWTGVDNGNILLIQKMLNPWTLAHEQGVVISRATHEWERHGFPVNEAPEILQRHGKIIVVYSACDTGTPDYCLGMLTANEGDNLLDAASWHKHPTPIFRRNDAKGVFGVGHNGFFKSPAGTQDWLVYHAKKHDHFTYEDRLTCAKPFTWNDDDTPNFGEPVGWDEVQVVPSGEK
jgi:GH43 family beta-xylosidase